MCRARGAGLSLQEENNIAMPACLQRFHSELQIRPRAIRELATMFDVVQANRLINTTEEELLVCIPKLTTFYDELSEGEI